MDQAGLIEQANRQLQHIGLLGLHRPRPLRAAEPVLNNTSLFPVASVHHRPPRSLHTGMHACMHAGQRAWPGFGRAGQYAAPRFGLRSPSRQIVILGARSRCQLRAAGAAFPTHTCLHGCCARLTCRQLWPGSAAPQLSASATVPALLLPSAPAATSFAASAARGRLCPPRPLSGTPSSAAILAELCRCIAYLRMSGQGGMACHVGGEGLCSRAQQCRQARCLARHHPLWPSVAPHLRSCRPASASSRWVGMRVPGGSGGSSPAAASSSSSCSALAAVLLLLLLPPVPRHSRAPPLPGGWPRMKRRSSAAVASASSHARRARRCVSQPSAWAVAAKPPRRTMACRE